MERTVKNNNADRDHIRELCAEACDGLPHRCTRFRRQMVVSHYILGACLMLQVLLVSDVVMAKPPCDSMATNSASTQIQTCRQVEQITQKLCHKHSTERGFGLS